MNTYENDTDIWHKKDFIQLKGKKNIAPVLNLSKTELQMSSFSYYFFNLMFKVTTVFGLDLKSSALLQNDIFTITTKNK